MPLPWYRAASSALGIAGNTLRARRLSRRREDDEDARTRNRVQAATLLTYQVQMLIYRRAAFAAIPAVKRIVDWHFNNTIANHRNIRRRTGTLQISSDAIVRVSQRGSRRRGLPDASLHVSPNFPITAVQGRRGRLGQYAFILDRKVGYRTRKGRRSTKKGYTFIARANRAWKRDPRIRRIFDNVIAAETAKFLG